MAPTTSIAPTARAFRTSIALSALLIISDFWQNALPGNGVATPKWKFLSLSSKGGNL